jgi:hypothetical protein
LIIFLLVVLQGILGFAAHRTPSGDFLRRIHVPVGIIAAAGMLGETWHGMHIEWEEASISRTVTPQGVQLLFWGLVVVWATLYVVAVVQGILSRNRSQEVIQMEKRADIEVSKDSDSADTL